MRKPAVSERNRFVRTKIPLSEVIIGGFLFLLLIGIAVTIGLKGRSFDPSLYNVRPESLKSTAQSVIGKDGTVPTVGEASSVEGAGIGYSHGGGAQDQSKPVAAANDPLELNLSGVRPLSDTEIYSADTLYEKINGRAPAYQGFNVQRLRFRSFSIVGSPGAFVDVYEFGFDTPVNAFGIFSLERDPKGGALDFVSDGYSGGMGFYFRQGKWYVQVIGSDTRDSTLGVVNAIARDRARSIPVDDTGLAARRRLPLSGLDASSVMFVQDNALGQDFLKSVFQATYEFGGKKIPFFIMAAEPAVAADAWDKFREFSGKYGGKAETLPNMSGARVFSAENFGAYKVVFQRAGEVGGVFDAEDPQAARQFVEQYLEGKLK